MDTKLYDMEQKIVELMQIVKNKNNELNQLHKSIVNCSLFKYLFIYVLLCLCFY